MDIGQSSDTWPPVSSPSQKTIKDTGGSLPGERAAWGHWMGHWTGYLSVLPLLRFSASCALSLGPLVHPGTGNPEGMSWPHRMTRQNLLPSPPGSLLCHLMIFQQLLEDPTPLRFPSKQNKYINKYIIHQPLLASWPGLEMCCECTDTWVLVFHSKQH